MLVFHFRRILRHLFQDLQYHLTMANNRNKFLTYIFLYSNYELFSQEYLNITYLKDLCDSFVILGSSGCYKSSLLHHLSQTLRYESHPYTIALYYLIKQVLSSVWVSGSCRCGDLNQNHKDRFTVIIKILQWYLQNVE